MVKTAERSQASIGSYSADDVIFLLKDISDAMEESSTEDREEAIQSGVHYSEMLPIEYNPSSEYIKLFYSSLEQYKEKLAIAVGVVAERIIEDKGENIVLVSLARAGTPIGILIKRYIEYKFKINVPHYSVSIIRGRGIDENAMKYIFNNHLDKTIQFIDGWTGKGAIKKELDQAVALLNEKYSQTIPSCMAVLADPGNCASIYGTRDDFLIPSACLNSTVSGLVSRTVLSEKYIGTDDFHGAKYYKELEEKDVSNFFIETICSQFPHTENEVSRQFKEMKFSEPSWKGIEDIKQIQQDFGIENINLIKPGVGETTRVLLRRVPWKILVKDMKNEDLTHILLLAKERNVPVEVYKNMSYTCCGLIKPLKEKTV
ncbi:cysteine protease StiP family protein [Metabacillus fastidiosus]|uniref:Cysteine protease StiP family protein n=1 Tax=Metabacillus fastidiosus TaxID=1458 RepID=A0ABU6P4E2_9BACI|nr:cysteine protease StiP family protein [Metabacillus fastidiosus]MED4452583.1 cysteine protease StiP family protein [Metabacillus fastidiosus]